jgi:hypothetical protein
VLRIEFVRKGWSGTPVQQNQMLVPGKYRFEGRGRADGLDTWSANRDRGYEGLRASAYVSRQMVGAADLDRYGEWQNTREYGPVWFPSAAAPNWAPYSDGYWTEPHASPNRDFTRLMFNSNWGNDSATDVDDYMVELPQNALPAAAQP